MYVSSGLPELSTSDLDEILNRSRIRNAAAGITGILLYGGGNFMQYFEGPKSAVDDLRAKLAIDPRHHDMLVMLYDPIEQRNFPMWRMGFLSSDRAQHHANFIALADDPALRGQLAKTDKPLEIVMRNFYENMR